MATKFTPKGQKALIVGAGTSGMATAITLSRVGVEVDLIDINPNWGALGAGITITGPTLRALKQLASGAGMGIEDALVLAEELAAARDVTDAFRRFMARREVRCRLVTECSLELGRLEQARAPVEAQTAVVERALARLAEPI